VDTVPLDEFGVLGACSLPIDEQCVRVSLRPGGQHRVVRYRNRILHARRDRVVYYKTLPTPASTCIISSNVSVVKGSLLPMWTTTTSPS